MARRVHLSDRMRATIIFSLALCACGGAFEPEDKATLAPEAGAAGETEAGAPSAGSSGSTSTGGAAGETETGGSGNASTGGATTGGVGARAGNSTGGSGSSAGVASGSGGLSGTNGQAGSGGQPWPMPQNVGECDPDGPGAEQPGYALWYTITPGTCLHWSNAVAKKVTCGQCERYENDQPGTCAVWRSSDYTHDPGTGAAVSTSCGVITVFPGEESRFVRLGANVTATYEALDPETGVCPESCGATRALRDTCLGGCTVQACCHVDASRTSNCDGAPFCDGIEPY